MRVSSIVRATKVAVFSTAFLATTSFVVPGVAVAKSDSDYKAELRDCRLNADPIEKDDCVSNARNRYGRGNGAAKKASETDDNTASSGGTTEPPRSDD